MAASRTHNTPHTQTSASSPIHTTGCNPAPSTRPGWPPLGERAVFGAPGGLSVYLRRHSVHLRTRPVVTRGKIVRPSRKTFHVHIAVDPGWGEEEIRRIAVPLYQQRSCRCGVCRGRRVCCGNSLLALSNEEGPWAEFRHHTITHVAKECFFFFAPERTKRE